MIANKTRHTKKRPPVRKKPVPVFDPIDDLQIVHFDLPIGRPVGPEPKKISNGPPIVYDKLYITDDESVYQWASKKLFLFRIFKLIYWLFRWFFDYSSFSPIWHSVLYVNDVVKNDHPIFVTDALVVNCQSIESFEKLIPYISGSYTRLMIHGDEINLNQLKQLLLPSARKVEVTAYIRLRYSEYDEAVQLIMQHVRGFRYSFKLGSSYALIRDVEAAVENNRYLATDWRDNGEVIHWTRSWFRYVWLLLRVQHYSRLFVGEFRFLEFLEPSGKTYWDCFKIGFFILLCVLGRASYRSKPAETTA